MSPHKKTDGRAKTLIALHLLLLVYSLSGIFSKNAAHEPFLSPMFILLYGGMLAILFIYAIGWQQILKRLSLSMAFANKAVTVIWGMRFSPGRSAWDLGWERRARGASGRGDSGKRKGVD